MNNYILEGKTPVLVDDILEWAEWFEKADRHVDKTDLPNGVSVSTVFLGLDHGWNGDIQLFETMVFGGDHDGFQDRCSTWEEAEAMHKRAIEMVFK